MTPLKLSYFSRKGNPSYWFADPYVCNCVYVGSEQNYDQFRRLERERAEEVTQENERRHIEEFIGSPIW